MDLALRPDLQKDVEDKLKAGQHTSVRELVEEALLVLREQERSSPAELEELRAELRAGLAASERGETAPWNPEEIKSEGRRHLNRED